MYHINDDIGLDDATIIKIDNIPATNNEKLLERVRFLAVNDLRSDLVAYTLLLLLMLLVNPRPPNKIIVHDSN